MRKMLVGAALCFPFVLEAPPVAAQSDPQARALIQQLLPRTSVDATRGIRPAAGGASAVVALPPPVPGAAEPAAPVVSRPAGPTQAAVPGTAAAPPATTMPAHVPAVSITVTFPTGSATLTPEAEVALGPLGRALTSRELASYRFRIEGHTDSVGNRDTNQTLSERRAAAVRDFLVQRYGVEEARVQVVGRGEDDLLVRTPDGTPEQRNRRVQVVNISG